MVEGLGLRVEGLGFRVQGLGFRVWGAGSAWGASFSSAPSGRAVSPRFFPIPVRALGSQGYLAHKKQLPPLGPP